MQPIAEIAARCDDAGVAASIPMRSRRSARCRRLRDLPCTLLTLSGHKIGAPKGIGALIVRDRKAVEAIIHGGGQQFGIRPGTENVAGAVALGRAAGCRRGAGAERRAAGGLRDRSAHGFVARAGRRRAWPQRRPARAAYPNIAIPGADSEALLMHLDLAGSPRRADPPAPPAPWSRRTCSPRWACRATLALGSIRFSLGHEIDPGGRRPRGRSLPHRGRKVRKLVGSARGRAMMSARARRHVRRRRQLRRGGPPGRAGLRRRRRHDEALLLWRHVPDRPCCSLDSINDARDVAQRLGIPHYVLNLEDRVLPPRHRELRGASTAAAAPRSPACAATPSPSSATSSPTPMRSDATTSPPATTPWRGRARLFRGRDRDKDQSYFLWGIDRAVVARMLTPVGEITKAGDPAPGAPRSGSRPPTSRSRSRSVSSPTTTMSACWSSTCPPMRPRSSPGPFVTRAGDVIGEHRGFARYTVGQRRGLPGGRARPLYVLEIRPEDRAVVVGGSEELGSREVQLKEINWLADPLAVNDRCHVQIRYRAAAVPARITAVTEGSLTVESEAPLRAVTPGQSGVLYDAGGRVLGGGVIS